MLILDHQDKFSYLIYLKIQSSTLYRVYVCIFVIYIEFFPYCLFVSNSQVIGCEDQLQNDLYCVGWGVKLYSIQSVFNSHVWVEISDACQNCNICAIWYHEWLASVCVGIQVGAVKEQVGAVKERIAGKSHELLNKWEEMSREFVTNFVELFGRDGRINSWLRESGRKVRRAISPPPSHLMEGGENSSLLVESPGTSSVNSSPSSSPPMKRSCVLHPDDWSDSDSDDDEDV